MNFTGDDFLKLLFWITPIVFSAGGVYAGYRALSKAVDALSTRLVQVEARMDGHERQDGHRVALERIEALKSNEEKVLSKLDGLDDRLRSMNETLIAVLARYRESTLSDSRDT